MISLGQLCDDNYIVVLTKKDLKAIKNNTTIIKGIRSTSGNNLWGIPIPQNTLPPKNPISTEVFSKITYPTATPNSPNIILTTDTATLLLTYMQYVFHQSNTAS